MYYIFNSLGKCVSTIDKKPDSADIASRNETAVASNETYDISKIELVSGVIAEVSDVHETAPC